MTYVSERLFAACIYKANQVLAVMTVGKFKNFHNALWFKTVYMLRFEQLLPKTEYFVASKLSKWEWEVGLWLGFLMEKKAELHNSGYTIICDMEYWRTVPISFTSAFFHQDDI